MAVKRVIVLTQSSSETEITYNGLFWIPVTSGIRTQTAGSLWVANGTSLGAAAAENTAIQNGTILEVPWSFQFPVGTPAATIEITLQQAWTNKNAQVNAVGPNQFYGFFYDGVAWANS